MPEPHHGSGAVDAEHADPTARSIFVVGAISLTLLAATVIGLEALHRRTVAREHERKVVEHEPQELRQVRSRQLETLNGYRWVDRDAGVVAIPIERAMQRMAEEARSPAAAGSVGP